MVFYTQTRKLLHDLTEEGRKAYEVSLMQIPPSESNVKKSLKSSLRNMFAKLFLSFDKKDTYDKYFNE